MHSDCPQIRIKQQKETNVKRKLRTCLFIVPKLSFLIFVFFYQPSLLIIMLTPLMADSTEKRFEVSQCLGPIQIQPHEAVLRSVKARSEMSLPFIVI